MYFYESKALPKISMLDGQRIEYVECILFRALTLFHLDSSLVDIFAIASSRCISASRVGTSTSQKYLVFNIMSPGVSSQSATISDSWADMAD